MIIFSSKNKIIVFAILLTTLFTVGQVQSQLLIEPGQYVFYGDDTRDLLGSTVQGVGDVNNDGFDDYAFSAPGQTYPINIDAGVIYLFFGRAIMIDLTTGDADVIFYGESARDFAGSSLAAAGDVNGDGYDDFLISSPNYGDTDIGKVYLITGQPTANWDKMNDLGSVSISFYGERDYSYLGNPKYNGDLSVEALAGIGDIDNDGYDDFAFGGELYEYSNSTPSVKVLYGKTYIYYGSASLSGSMNVSSADFSINAENRDDVLGSVAGIGDINADGFDDYAVRSQDYGSGGYHIGAIYIMYGGSERVTGSYNISDIPYGALIHDEFFGITNFGSSIIPIGDHNNDGTPDFAVSAEEYWNEKGVLYVFYGKEYSGVINATDADKKFYGEVEYANFGIKAAKISDLNGDGVPELAISDAGSEIWNDHRRGRIIIFYGSDETGEYTAADADLTLSWEGGIDGMALGLSMANAGDINGDNFDDLIVGAPYYTNETFNLWGVGAVILITNMRDYQVVTETETETETQTELLDGTEIGFLPISTYSIIGGVLIVAVYKGNARKRK